MLIDLDQNALKNFNKVPRFFQEWKIENVKGLVQPLTKLLLDHVNSKKLSNVSFDKSEVDDNMFGILADLYCTSPNAKITVEEDENAIAKPKSHVVSKVMEAWKSETLIQGRNRLKIMRITITKSYVKSLKKNINLVQRGENNYLYEAKKDEGSLRIRLVGQKVTIMMFPKTTSWCLRC
ncbi:hypothetical protein QR680_011937 [Steinernema hermaphroditum]|uniref:Uncharacterized protein n=1 Tax=Steinernema hermaphroditum TaxID=289476 RepID=A0AA39I090_9BILA|nr:hypothetical protein QR680_011937 [Steinernema hermaphroditum]